MPNYVWGVDSASNVTAELLDCVTTNFGRPVFWGRYLTRVEGASEGLSPQEINFLRDKGIKIMPIYNVFTSATGYQKGKEAAYNAVHHANNLGFPKGTAIFANVERFFEVDHHWIKGWVDALYTSGYKTGIYHDPVTGGFNQAYCQAARESNRVKVQTILWSAEPETGATKATNAPAFNPQKPDCEGNVWLWQYGRDVKECPIDTNLADERVLQMMW
ncbi:glycoside hydrolase domain-containing protein [Lederbergia graminis]|uniref:Glycoside hydrolase domain-containing protein n=1 Tax=Lederbergia graminis TaxID=735518 RepID=A0ABW0LCI4_9BACI